MPCAQARILQIHPTRFCNLSCLHCYSSSGPTIRDGLPVGLIEGALADAAAEGYTIAGFSGGEPTLYPQLPEAVRAARAHGFTVTVTTNGTRLTAPLLDALTGNVDLVAVSIDGRPASHDHIRGSSTAFKRMDQRIPALRESGIPFGFIFTLTQHNLDELPWVAEYALEQGAGLLQVHPLEGAGRALECLHDAHPDGTELSYAFILAARLRAVVGDAMRLEIDLSERRALESLPPPPAAPEAAPLSALANPLVIESDGTVVPGQHGMARVHALGNLQHESIAAMGRRWAREGFGRYHAVRARAAAELLREDAGTPFINWQEQVAMRAQAATP